MPRELSLHMRRLRIWLALVALASAFAFAYWPVFRHWWHEWMRPGGCYSHGPLVVAIAVWVAFARGRASLRLADKQRQQAGQEGKRSPAVSGGGASTPLSLAPPRAQSRGGEQGGISRLVGFADLLFATRRAADAEGPAL